MADTLFVRYTTYESGKPEWAYRELSRADALKELIESLYHDCVELNNVRACIKCPLNKLCLEESTLLDYMNNVDKLEEFNEYAIDILDQCECTEQQEADEKMYREWADERAIGD